jgi:hypothetical protein
MEGSPSACRLPDRVTRAQITAATWREWTSPPMRDASTHPRHRVALHTPLVPLMKKPARADLPMLAGLQVPDDGWLEAGALG